MISLIKKLLGKFGVGVVRQNTLNVLREKELELNSMKSLLELQTFLYETLISRNLISKAIQEFPRSTSQLQQDLFALIVSDFKVGGYFVEFGATNGVTLSNTHLLEKHFGWTGILAEPAMSWHSSLYQNRNAIIDIRCVWSRTGDTILFNETKIGELSTVDSMSLSDMHSENRKYGKKYNVETITLEDLLDFHRSPHFIDYLSIDTEGSEYEILRNFNFEKYSFGFISCEHNFTPNRDLIRNLLTNKGYVQVFPAFSKFDDWYAHESFLKQLGCIN